MIIAHWEEGSLQCRPIWQNLIPGADYEKVTDTGVGIDALYDAAQYFFPQYGVRTELRPGHKLMEQETVVQKKTPTLRALGENL